MYCLIALLPLLIGWALDLLLGDPERMPHPIVGFGRIISLGEHRLNKGSHRRLKGGVLAVALILLVFFGVRWLLGMIASLSPILYIMGATYIVFTCLAGTTLIREVREVFRAAQRSLEEGRRQVARIVGRDTEGLSAQEVRTAALETLAENLNDGVIAPLFWLLLLGPAGMMAYKMVNTLDSMIGYHSERYREFGFLAAKIDDVAGYVPARLTALLMILAASLMGMGRPGKMMRFVMRYGSCHASPNSGWPEAALAAALGCRFGGPHNYFGQLFVKPYIGHNERPLTMADMRQATRINRLAEVFMIMVLSLLYLWPSV